ncbi:MAG: hypothetical protein GX998_05420 [Firmicutes bacterium]|nr:hypothetical protein [Bacillota bacterium]
MRLVYNTCNCVELDSGQALIEFVLISPILLILLWGVFQLALICEANLVTHMAVRHAAQVYLDGGGRRAIQEEMIEYFGQYPFMDTESVQSFVIESTFMATILLKCTPLMLPLMDFFGEPPVITASMSLNRELFDIRRIPDLDGLKSFREYLRGGKRRQ